jgi:AcrR family transcriptional regulator
MPRPRFMRMDERRREEILEAAAQEFATHGYEQASLNRLLEVVGLSKGSFYYYFDDKADLFGSVLSMVWERCLAGSVADISGLSAADFWPYIDALARANRELLRSCSWIVGISKLLHDPPGSPEARKVVEERMVGLKTWRLELLRRGQEVGAVRRDLPVELLAAMVAGLDGAVDRWLLASWEQLDRDERERLMDVLFSLSRLVLAPEEHRARLDGHP